MEMSLERFRSRSRSFESNLNRGQDTRARTGLDQAHNHTLICPFGKTHNHRSRGDTPWRGGADSTKHTQTETRGRGSQEVKGGDGSKPCARARSQPLPALTYRGQPAAFAPRSLSIHVGLATGPRRFIVIIPCFSGRSVDFLRVPTRLHISSRLRCHLAGCGC